MSAYRSSLFRSLKKEVSEKLPQGFTTVPYEGVGGQTCRMVEYGPTVAQCRSTMPIV